MATVVQGVEMDKPAVHYRAQVNMTHDDTPWAVVLDVRDGGHQIAMYRATEKGPKLVSTIKCAPNRKPDMNSALEKVLAWAHEKYED